MVGAFRSVAEPPCPANERQARVGQGIALAVFAEQMRAAAIAWQITDVA